MKKEKPEKQKELKKQKKKSMASASHQKLSKPSSKDSQDSSVSEQGLAVIKKINKANAISINLRHSADALCRSHYIVTHDLKNLWLVFNKFQANEKLTSNELRICYGLVGMYHLLNTEFFHNEKLALKSKNIFKSVTRKMEKQGWPPQN